MLTMGLLLCISQSPLQLVSDHVISSSQWTMSGSSELMQLRASVPPLWHSKVLLPLYNNFGGHVLEMV